MTSTTFKLTTTGKLFLYVVVPILVMIACAEQPQQTVKNRVPALSEPATAAPAPAPTSEAQQPAPAPKKVRPWYGTTHFDGEITSVYWYPEGSSGDDAPDTPSTHIKFQHREDDIWLCGDHRREFEVGRSYSMFVTFEANTDCQTNWKLK